VVRSSIVACLLLGVLFVGNPMVSNGTKAAPASIGEVATVASTQADSVAALLLLQQRLDRIFTSPGYRPVGVSAKVVSLRTGRTLYERNADLPLTPASTTKLFTTASLYWLSGADARLHTEARTTGTLDANGTLRGDLFGWLWRCDADGAGR
jgi:D-alanyl-D-alanine carboxypeptidase/D-alanyl-D-alanine-endopeptidase (penicillin-binding protein 4)